MIESSVPAPSTGHRSAYVLAAVVGVFGLLLVGILALRYLGLAAIERDLDAAQDVVVARAFEAIEADWASLQLELIEEARRLASEPDVWAGLSSYDERSDEAGVARLLRFFAGYGEAETGAIEIYGTDGALLAWKGHSVHLDRMPARAAEADDFEMTMVDDAGLRRALTLWWPMRDAGRPIGVLRVSRLVAARMPVENQYLRSFDQADTWRRLTRLPVEVRYDAAWPDVANQPHWHMRSLRDIQGEEMGRIYLEAPGPAALAEATRQRYANLLAIWATTLLFLALAGCWRWVWVGSPGAAALARLGVFLAALWASRLALLALEVPGRWQRGKTPFAALFDPSHFASDYGFGLMQSMGDLFTTALFVALTGAVLWRWADRSAGLPVRAGRLALLAGPGILVALLILIAQVQGQVIRHAVLDSTLDYFARTGLLPDRLVLFVFCALVVLALGFGAIGAALARHVFSRLLGAGPLSPVVWGGLVLGAGVLLAVVYRIYAPAQEVPISATLGIVLVGCGGGWLAARRGPDRPIALYLRRQAAFILLLILPAYLMLNRGMQTQLQLRMVEAVDTFDAERDPGVVFAVEQLLDEAREEPALRNELALATTPGQRIRLNEALAQRVVSSPLANLGTYEVSLTLFDTAGVVRGRYVEGEGPAETPDIDAADRDDFRVLSQIYDERNEPDSLMVELMTGRRVASRLQYEGFAPLTAPGEAGEVIGWSLARIEPKTILQDDAALFPRVLLPASVLDVQSTFAIAEFRDQTLYRNMGSVFGRFRLGDDVARRLRLDPTLWLAESAGDREYLTYYTRRLFESAGGTQGFSSPMRVIAVRAPMLHLFDHLYYLLRMTLAALLVLALFYALTRLVHRNVEEVRVRFADRVLNAFLSVGMSAVLVVSVLGLQVINRENESAIQSWIDQELDRVEENLALQAEVGELPGEVLARTNLSTLAAGVGLDLNVYRGNTLYASSRQQLVRERLIDTRMPPAAYERLFFAGDRNAFTHERVGTFSYRAGYRALPDREGRPDFVISVPTLPEQERIEEERARTVAYLFGSLLLLMLLVMLTAGLLANTLTRPIGRLREGLEAVAKGRFERPLPVETDDEIGELVQTFNQMQEQLAESRRRLTQQERQLAWREMARQVAHEIKNPLTPMKLSVQHLRRAFTDARSPANTGADGKFASLFERITTTLIEQVDALARIANEFSTFARMPTQNLEPLDLNAVVREAVDLMQEQQDVEIALDLHPIPLIVLGDREELRRIYINLIKNAIEATADGRPNPIVVATGIRAEAGASLAYSTVRDQGSGIEPGLRGKIFEPNFSSKTSGTGLGLAIVRKSVEDMRGTIGFETELGVGTTFWIVLPLLPG